MQPAGAARAPSAPGPTPPRFCRSVFPFRTQLCCGQASSRGAPAAATLVVAVGSGEEEKDRQHPSLTVLKSPTSLKRAGVHHSRTCQNSGLSLAKLAAPGEQGLQLRRPSPISWSSGSSGYFSLHLSSTRGSLKARPSGPASSSLPAGPAIPAPHTARGVTASRAGRRLAGAAGLRKKGRGRRRSGARRAGPGRGGVGGRTGRSRRPLRPAPGRRVCAGPWA